MANDVDLAIQPTTAWARITPGAAVSEDLLTQILAAAAVAVAAASQAAIDSAAAVAQATAAAMSADGAEADAADAAASAAAALAALLAAQAAAAAAAASAAAAAASAAAGLPVGGTAGQVLAKIDATNYNTEWIDFGGGSLVSGATVLLEADAGLSLSDTDPVTTWSDQSGNSNHFIQATAGFKPIFNAADTDDALPYVSFDGTDDYLQRIFSSAYSGTELTIYFVVRSPNVTSNRGFANVTVAGESGVADNVAVKWAVLLDNKDQLSFSRDAATYGMDANTRGLHSWTVAAARWRLSLGRGVLTTQIGNNYSTWDLGITSLVALGYDRTILGSLYSNFGLPGNFTKVDLRAYAEYRTAHTDAEMKSMISYLGDKWLANQLG